MREMNIKDMDYVQQRALVRGYKGQNEYLMNAMRRQALKDTMNFVTAIRIMDRLNWREDQIAEVFDKMILDGHVAYEIVWDDDGKNVIGLNELDPASLVPSYSSEIGYYWMQHPENKDLARQLFHTQVLYLTNRKVFDAMVDTIAEEPIDV